MIPALIIFLKALSAILLLYRLYILLRFYKSDKNVRFSLDIPSMIEVDGTLAISFLVLLMRIDEKAYFFSCLLGILAVGMNLLQSRRVIFAGENRILIGNRDFDLSQIKGMNASRFSLNVYIKGGEKIRIIVPLSTNETIRRMKYLNKKA